MLGSLWLAPSALAAEVRMKVLFLSGLFTLPEVHLLSVGRSFLSLLPSHSLGAQAEVVFPLYGPINVKPGH